MPGLSNSGFEPKRTPEIIDDIVGRVQSNISSSINTASDSIFMQFVTAVSEEIAQVWSGEKAIYDAINPDNSYGEMLEALASYIGLTRLDGKPSTGEIKIFGSQGVQIDSGSEFEHVATKNRFKTTQTDTIPASGEVVIPVESVNNGPISGDAGDELESVSTISGLGNPEAVFDSDVSEGRLVEPDDALRIRRELSLGVLGKGTDYAIRGDLLTFEGIENVIVLSNRTDKDDYTTALAPHQIKIIVWPPPANTANIDQVDVFKAIYRTHPGGNETEGTQEAWVTAKDGTDVKIRYSPAIQRDVYVDVSVDYDADDYPSNGDDVVEDKILEIGNALDPGEDVIHLNFLANVDEVDGVLDATVDIDFSQNPSNTSNLPVAFDQIAVFDSSRILVNSTAV